MTDGRERTIYCRDVHNQPQTLDVSIVGDQIWLSHVPATTARLMAEDAIVLARHLTEAVDQLR
ncbi:MAG: hypothetical protein M3548_04505 [Actinomycetota bacterium]|nr:hypothetical protein [Actinomycetota bacterium]